MTHNTPPQNTKVTHTESDFEAKARVVIERLWLQSKGIYVPDNKQIQSMSPFIDKALAALIHLHQQEILHTVKLLDQRQGDEYLLCDTCHDRRNSRLGGAAMTLWRCNRCGGSELSGSTAHGAICTKCAIVYKKCRWCNFNDNKLAEMRTNLTNTGDK